MSSRRLSPALVPVQSLVVTFLVDNTIEWFGKLPPGFTREMRQHLDQHPPPDPDTGVPVLDLERFCCGAHGFSALIETRASADTPSHLTLFDTGPDSQSLVRNLAALQIRTPSISRVVLSHWHADHTGGLLSFLAHRAAHPELAASTPTCVVDAHPSRPRARGIAPPPGDEVLCRLPADPSFAEMADAGARVEMHDEGHAVAGGTVWVSGEIPRVTEFEGGLLGGVRFGDSGEWAPEAHLMDERYAAIDVLGKGLVLFSACSHAGIVNVVKDAVATFSRPIIGGLHLGGPELAPRIAPTVDFLARRLRPAPAYVLPMHCSGFDVKVALQAALGEGCVPAGAGMQVKVLGESTDEARVFPPSIAI
ncbi:hypothetical protein HETIRDRAFT_61468 [Heterobasidion irregulare TC 32-1]|uniref:Metallo-beta-lactamase domain-containing protein n=1 Tax=Heterobasidion irregulare (strain TC 32-1) TaxID=747525 RepID=W4K3F8_HETIT|nr:uncharacterized protein HETIRDRAFT_61468 [Heterobasidion irregulare TC 32-1]ETW80363.1 hypothetical protein HETIRDRAFT_61468 [Heterobasidion irregulare TC 32-1]